MLKKLPLLLFILGLSYCTWWVAAISHLEQIEDDEYVGKTLLIYPSAGEFVLKKHWYFGKKSGDSYFSSSRVTPDADTSPRLYRVKGKYQEYYHGMKRMFGKYGITQYLIQPVGRETDRRLFFSRGKKDKCKESDLIDPETGIKVDFVCKSRRSQ
jgi:hypothetical protein